MKNTKKLIDIFIVAMLVFLSTSSVLRTVALFTSFNDKTMHFDGSITFTLSAVFAALAAFIFLSGLFLVPKGYSLAPNSTSPALFVPSGILAVALLFMSFTMIVRAYNLRTLGASGIGQLVKCIPVALAVFAILSAAFFFLNVMLAKRTGTAKAVLGMCAVIFFALYGVYLYFSKEVHPTNSPNKIIDQMAYFSTALFCLFETRIALGRDMWKGYLSFGLVSALLTGYSAIPALIYYLTTGVSISNSITETVLTLTMFLYVLAKLLLTRKLPSDNQCKMAATIERIATKRESELLERRNASHARDYDYNEENATADTAVTEAADDEAEPAEGQISFELDPPTQID